MSGGVPLLAAEAVSVTFAGGLQALDRVSLALHRDEAVGLVGESGSGKSTLCRVLLGLTAPTSGVVRAGGEELGARLRRDAPGFRRGVQLLAQDAVAALSPRLTVRALVEEPLRIHGVPLPEGRARLAALMGRLGLPAGLLDAYPHQLSGGQARRVGLLRALMLDPGLIVADEPTAGLDASVRGELLNLLMEIKAASGLALLVVSHDLAVVRRVTGRVLVMYLGQVVEEGGTGAVFAAPAHPYAAALLAARPALELPLTGDRPRASHRAVSDGEPVSTSPENAPGAARRGPRAVLEGEVPSALNPPPGCRFHTRCPRVRPRCLAEPPALREVAPARLARCHDPLTGEAPPG